MKALWKLNRYFIRYKWHLLLGFLFVTASNLFAIFPAQLVRKSIDLIKDILLRYSDASEEVQESLRDDLSRSVLVFTGLVILFAVLRGLFMYLMRQSLIVMSRHIEFDMKNTIFQHYQKLDPGFFNRNRTGDMMARISEDVSRVRMYVGPAIMYTINLGVTIVLVLIVMFSVNPHLTWLVVLPLPLLSIAIFWINNLINKRSDAIQEQLSNLTSYVQEAFSGIRVIKAFAAERFSIAGLEKETAEYRTRQMALARVDAFFFPLMLALVGLSSLITIYIGGLEVIAGKATLGNIAEFVIYVNLLTWPVASLGYTSSLIQRAAASQSRIQEFLDTQPNLTWPEVGLTAFEKEIKIYHLQYTYPGKERPALMELNFSLPKGSTTAILGTTGSGKTTLIQLLLRSFDPEIGRVEIDGVDLRKINLSSFRQKIGYVPQDVFLFSESIRNNILFGLPDDDPEREEKLLLASKYALLDEAIQSFPDGFETRIGERGISLSGGQKQRVAIARALIRDPEILILDDCLSALDTKTEAGLLKNLGDLGRDKTVLIVSHRVSSVKNAGQILVLEEGKVEESGTHAELLERGGKYASLYRRQILEDNKEENG